MLCRAAANRYLDIIDNNIDVAIRTREVELDSNITIRRLCETRRILAAAPRYLAQHGAPKTPDAFLEAEYQEEQHEGR